MSEIEQYDYDLPRERIAQNPMQTRSDARLMLVQRSTGKIDHYYVRDLPDLVHADDIMVMNNSRVIPARLIGYRTKTQGRWQGLFLQADPDTGIWEVLT
ncbi:MAG: S-adenosylmethionine:tRNA ribosyltransferase-isomerase, partial [Pirellulaceae bacterium]|nr:S-adenosylmethionine:tRNA ribosyltransferase-isomerase [Pirellulaceae bacterium]